MTLRKCPFCEHLWVDRPASRHKVRDRCPDCHRSLKISPLSRVRIIIPTSWLKERIKKTVDELDNLPWTAETEGRRNKLQGRLEDLKTIEKTFVLPEEESLDPEEMSVLNAEPEAVVTIVPLATKVKGA